MKRLNVLRKLAEGAVARTFLVRDDIFERNAILELLHPEILSDAEHREKLFKLLRDTASVEHPHLLGRHHTQRSDDGLFILSAPFKGQPLAELLKVRGTLSPSEIIALMVPLSEALACLHESGQKHGNLTPEHVFVEPDRLNRPWLCDTLLTLTRSIPSTHGSADLVKSEYLAPERIKGRRGTVTSDIYGMGVLMYELVTGAPPFSGPTSQATRKLHLDTLPPPMPDSADGLADIIMRCLAKDQAQRFASAKALGWALQLADASRQRAKETQVMDSPTLGQLKAQVGFEEKPAAPGASEWLGEYELIDLLGQGGMGRVFLARDFKNNREVALKVLRSEMAKDPTNLKRFVDEATTVSRIHHPHIVEVYELVRAPDCTYCVMEPLRGHTLGELLHDRPLPVGRALSIMRQVCEALDAAHQLGVVHRDVKPDNIFLCERPDGEDFVKLLDFGVAKHKPADNDLSQRVWQTQGGVMVGTPMYMAPEQALGDAVDERTDIYIVGTVLYRILAGAGPFNSSTTHNLIAELLTKPPPPLADVGDSGDPTPPELAQLVYRCLEKVPAKRVQSMKELAAALTAIQHTL